MKSRTKITKVTHSSKNDIVILLLLLLLPLPLLLPLLLLPLPLPLLLLLSISTSHKQPSVHHGALLQYVSINLAQSCTV